MDDSKNPTRPEALETPGKKAWPWLLCVCLIAAGLRLYHLNAPLADNLQAKQTYSSNKARNIARAPFDPMRLSLDLLDDTGRPMDLAEEVPIYIGLVAAAFAALGESEIWGRLLSIAGSLIAILAFFDLARREHGERLARVATLLFACMPLFVFYGRAVMPDSWMLAMMLCCAAAHRRFLDSGQARWLVVAALTGALTVLFKYWGLMIVLVLADMTRAARGWKAWFKPDFILLMAGIVIPTFLWMLLVFAPAPNPVQNGWVAGQPPSPYLVIQRASVLLDRGLYASFFQRFLARDCGVITCGLIVIGLWATARRRPWLRYDAGSLARWSAMALVFYAILAPKMLDHDYYELMMLPAAAVWAALGWTSAATRLAARAAGFKPAPRFLIGRAAPALVLGLAVVLHSPWVARQLFVLDQGKVELGRALAAATNPADRVVVLGPSIALIVPVHYSQREGWAVRATALPPDWAPQLLRWKEQGAVAIGLYFDAKTSRDERRSFQPLIDTLTTLKTASIPASSGRTGYEYVVLSLAGNANERLANAARTSRR